MATVLTLRESALDWDRGMEEKLKKEAGFHHNLRCYSVECADVCSSIIHNS